MPRTRSNLSSAPKGRKTTAQGNALGSRPPTNPSPEGAACVIKTGRDLFKIVTSGSRGWAKYYSETGAAFLRVGNLDRATISLDLSEIQRVSPPAGVEGIRTSVQPGDLLISITADIGMVGVASDGLGEAYINQHVALVRTTKEIDPRYAAWFIASPQAQDQFSALRRGAVKAGLGLDDIRALEIPLPSLPEQRRIVARIEELFSRLDAGVAALRHAQAQLQRYRQSVLAAAVTGQLTQAWREQHPDSGRVDCESITAAHQEELESRGRKPGKLQDFDQEGQPFGLPTSWRWFRAEQLCDLITKGTTPKKEMMSEDGDIPYIKVYNLTFDGRLNFGINPTFTSREVHEGELKRSIVFPGDVLINIVGPPLGKVSIVPATHPEWNINQAIAVFKPVCGVLNSYLAIVLREQSLLEINKRKAKATAGQFNLTLAICRDSAVPVPTIPEQHQIVAEFEARTTAIDRLEAELDLQITRASRLRQGILASAFSGEGAFV